MTPGRDAGDTEHLLRDLAPQVLGALLRRFDDFAAAEDAVQEALVAAAGQWPREGAPDRPLAWLVRVASRRMIDQVRSDASRREREGEVAREAGESVAPAADRAGEDDALVILFMCCHPSLTTASAIALTLRAVGGLTTAEIAAAFLVPEATMAQRISRAKQTIRASGVPFDMPTREEHPRRLVSVLHVLYLVFNEGYTSSFGSELHRTELAREAIRLTRQVRDRLPDDPEVLGLLALMLLTDARREARTGPGGELVPLSRQDRTRWDVAQIAEGVALVTEALAMGRVGPYQLQAAVAAVHDEAPSTEETDWAEIEALYGLLDRMSDNPMVALNRAIATAMVRGPAAGLAALDALEGDARLAGNHRLPAVRAHLLELAGERAEAVALYRAAAGLTSNLPERDYLVGQAARLEGGVGVEGRG